MSFYVLLSVCCMGVIKIAGDQWPPLLAYELFKPDEVVVGVHKVHIIKENDLCYTVVFYILADGLIHDVVINAYLSL